MGGSASGGCIKSESSLTVTTCNFSDNICQGGGGMIGGSSSGGCIDSTNYLYIASSQFYSNQALGGGGYIGGNSEGGAVFGFGEYSSFSVKQTAIGHPKVEMVDILAALSKSVCETLNL